MSRNNYTEEQRMKNFASWISVLLGIGVIVLVSYWVGRIHPLVPKTPVRPSGVIVRVYSGGQLMQGWTNVQKLQTMSAHSDAIVFRTIEGALITVSGEYIVTGE